MASWTSFFSRLVTSLFILEALAATSLTVPPNITTTTPSTFSTSGAGRITSAPLVPLTANISTCSGTVSPLELYGPQFLDRLVNLGEAAQLAYVQSVLTAFATVFRQYNRLNALGDAVPPATRTSLYNAQQSILTTDLFGTDGFAYLYFATITDACLRQTCFNQLISQSSAFLPRSSTELYFYKAQPPCCGACTVTARNVQLQYWPTPAPEPPISIVTDTVNNFIFSSPTEYAAFTELGAGNQCGGIGTFFPVITVPFTDGELSTTKFSRSQNLADILTTTWTAINYADFNETCFCTKDCEFDSFLNKTLSYTCTPQLSVPTKLFDLDPAWATCVPQFGGFFDPPRALTRAGGLDPGPTTDPVPVDPSPTPTPPVLPGNSPTTPIIPPTPQPVTQPDSNPTPPPPPPPPSPPPPAPVGPAPEPVGPAPAPADPAPAPVSPPPAPQNPPAAPIPVVDNQPPAPNPAADTPPVPAGPQDNIPPAAVAAPLPAPLTINDEPITANSASEFIIGSQTLAPGSQAITVSGTVISLAPGATEVVIDGSSVELSRTTPVLGAGGATASPVPFTGGARGFIVWGSTEWLGIGLMIGVQFVVGWL